MAHGLRLAFVGQPEYNAPLYESDLDELYVVERFALKFDPHIGHAATARSMATLVEFQPDVSIFFRPEFFSNDLLSRLGGMKVGISTETLPKYIDDRFHFTRDSIERFKMLLRAADRAFDYIFHYDAASLGFMQRMGVRLSGSLTLPVATNTWCPAAARDAEWDFVFIGRSTEHRERYFRALKRDYRFLHIAHGVVGKAALPYYHASRIGLNIHSEPELAWEPRVQQLLAAGLLVISEAISPNDMLRPGEHFLEVRDPDEAHEVCGEALANPEKFAPVRAAGQEQVRRNLSARQIWPRLIEQCLDGRFARASFDLGRVHLTPFEVCAELDGFDHLLDQLRGEHA